MLCSYERRKKCRRFFEDKKIPTHVGNFYFVNLASANLPKNADSISPSKDISPSFKSSSPCNFSRYSMIVLHILTKSLLINFAFNKSDLNISFLFNAIKCDSAILSANVSRSSVRRSYNKCSEYESVDQ